MYKLIMNVNHIDLGKCTVLKIKLLVIKINIQIQLQIQRENGMLKFQNLTCENIQTPIMKEIKNSMMLKGLTEPVAHLN